MTSSPPITAYLALLKFTLQPQHILMFGQHMAVQKFGEFEPFAAMLNKLYNSSTKYSIIKYIVAKYEFYFSPALCAIVFLLAVNLNVFVESGSILEYFLAVMAHKIVFFTVYLHVNIEGVSVSENLIANVACLQTFSCMNSHVILQFLLFTEDNVADWTRFSLFPRVCSLMGVAGTLVTKGHFTKLALVWFDSEVYSYMSLQITFLYKLFRTMGALVSWSHMNQEMFIKRVPSVEFFSTMITLVYFAVLMTHSVIV